ncbi:Auxin efflux carrier component 1a [Bienertia sinuspersici]
MYDETLSQSLMVQLSVIQFNVWFPVLLFLYEYRRATRLVSESESESESEIEMKESNENGSPRGSSKKNCNESLDEFDEEKEMGVGVVPSEILTKISESHDQGVCRSSDDNGHEIGENGCPRGLPTDFYLFIYFIL